MHNLRIEEGDIVAIRVSIASEFLCRVLFVSKRYRFVALVGCYGVLREGIEPEEQIKAGKISSLTYTTIQPKEIAENWRRIGTRIVTEEEYALSRRIVAGEVWQSDNHLGTASPDELQQLPQMDVYGARVFAKRIVEKAQQAAQSTTRPKGRAL